MAADPTPQPTEARAIAVLRDVLETEPRFPKVHAAEALIEIGLPQGIHAAFLTEEREHRDLPVYRIGIWRVLARATAGTPAEHDRWLDNIRKVALNPAAPDRIGAVESLAKLNYPVTPAERPAFESLAASGTDDGIALFSLWLLSHAPGAHNPQDRVAHYLDAADPITRLRAFYILRFLPDLSPENRAKLKAAARAEPAGTPTHAYATSSSFIVAGAYGDAAEARRARAQLHRILQAGKPPEKQEACRALGQAGSAPDDLDAVAALLADPEPPARIGAALATTRLVRQQAHDRTPRHPGRVDAKMARPAPVG